MFQERCKTSGERIVRTVDKVEGIYLLKLRPEGMNYGEQFAMTDPYGRDMTGDGYIKSFLHGSYEAETSGTRIEGAPPPPKGYRYVEAIDPRDGKRYRYTGRNEEPWQTNKAYLKGYTRFALDKTPAPGQAPRYGVTYEDLSTREDREYWIAGSSLKVIDLQTNEVIAERIGYMWDPAQGSRAGGRAPWLFAPDHACPSFQRNLLRPPGHGAEAQIGQTESFVQKSLKPKLEN